MKTKSYYRPELIRMLFVILPVITLLALGSASCGKSNNINSSNNDILIEVDEMPVFTGGDQALLNFISTNTTYPEEAKNKNITGKVIIKFVVEKDGTISDVEVAKSVNPLLDNEALRVVRSLPKFETPAKKGGEIVRVQYMVPISFMLN